MKSGECPICEKMLTDGMANAEVVTGLPDGGYIMVCTGECLAEWTKESGIDWEGDEADVTPRYKILIRQRGGVKFYLTNADKGKAAIENAGFDPDDTVWLSDSLDEAEAEAHRRRSLKANRRFKFSVIATWDTPPHK